MLEPARSRAPLWLALASMMALTALACGWGSLRPVPDWRMELHFAVLGLDALALAWRGAAVMLVAGWRGLLAGLAAMLLAGAVVALALVTFAAHSLAFQSSWGTRVHVRISATQVEVQRVETTPFSGIPLGCERQVLPIVNGLFLGRAVVDDDGCG